MKRTLLCLANFIAFSSWVLAQESNLIPPPAVPTPPADAPKPMVVPEDKEAVESPVEPSPVVPAPVAKPVAGTSKANAVPDGPADPLAAPEAASRAQWQLEISFRPNQNIQSLVFGLPSSAPAKPWHFHKLERGVGPVSLEYQELRIGVPPKVLGKPMTAEEVQYFIRSHFMEFMDPKTAKAQPRSFDDRWRILSKNAPGAVLSFEYAGPTPKKASMVISDQIADRWALTSVYTGVPGVEDHRVAGTRWIGVDHQDKKGGFSFFTKAAVRSLTEPALPVLDQDAAVWTGFLESVKTWVESLEGKAEMVTGAPPIRQEWDHLKLTHFSPLEKWKDIDGVWEVKETRDTKKRFRVEIHEGMAGATLIERSPSGRELKRDTRLSGAGPNTWVLERAQDMDVLDFLGVAEGLAKDAMAATPPPSTLTITRKGETLLASWKGIVIQTNGQNKLDRITTRTRSYEMIPSK